MTTRPMISWNNDNHDYTTSSPTHKYKGKVGYEDVENKETMMEDWEYEALSRDFRRMPGTQEERRPVGRPKGSRNKTQKKPRIYVNMRDIFEDDHDASTQGVQGRQSSDAGSEEGVDDANE